MTEQEAQATVVPILGMAARFEVKTELDHLIVLLMETWGKADPRSSVAQHPASYVATFGDLARAAIEWERSRLSPRVVVAAPSDTDRKLIDSLRRKARFFERPEGEGANETELLLNEAADALSRASQPVQVEVTDDMVDQIFDAAMKADETGTDEPLRAALSAALGGGDHAE